MAIVVASMPPVPLTITFDTTRHKISFKAQLGKYYNQTAGNVSTEKVAATDTTQMPVELEDITSGEINGTN